MRRWCQEVIRGKANGLFEAIYASMTESARHARETGELPPWPFRSADLAPTSG